MTRNLYDRYAIYSKAEQLETELGVSTSDGYTANYNAAPTQLLPVIISEKPEKLSFFHWGLMTKWANNKTLSPKTINLKAEIAFERTRYKRQIQIRRCIIPINGFYAWKKVSRKQIIPHYFFSKQTPILGIAGLWEEFEDTDGTLSHSFILLTVSSSYALSEIEGQMPAFLDPIGCSKWLTDGDSEGYMNLILGLTNNHVSMISHPVSPAISEITNNYPELIHATPAADQHGNYTLFT